MQVQTWATTALAYSINFEETAITLATITPKPPLKILQASAGSGKTFSLTAQYLTLLFANEFNYRQILAVTFTNKATEEMKTRILQVLKGIATKEKGVEPYRQIILEAYPFFTPEILADKATIIYRRILHDYSRFSVSTIDSFVQGIIRDFAFELGLDAGYTVEMNTDRVIEDLSKKLIEHIDEEPALLNWMIEMAKERLDDGKAWNYENELHNLAKEIFKEHYQPFTRAIEKLIASEPGKDVFESYKKLTRNTIQNIENKRGQAAQVFFDAHQRFSWDESEMVGKSRNPLPKIRVADDVLNNYNNLKKLVGDPACWFKHKQADQAYLSINPLLENLVEIVETTNAEYLLAQAVNRNFNYLRLMRDMAVLLKKYREEKALLLISDAQYLLSGMLAKDPTVPAFIWEKTGTRFKHYLFDEFQDTSSVQWENFLPLVINSLSASEGINTEHLIVGDVKQSIYRWRNGNWEILHKGAATEFESLFHSAIYETANLAANYRSTEEIIAFNNFLYQEAPKLVQQSLNDLIDSNASAAAQDCWRKKNYNSIVTGIYQNAKQELHAGTLKGGSVHINVVKADEENRYKDGFVNTSLEEVVKEINRLLNEKNYLLSDICLLVRTNIEAATCVEHLMLNKIPVISGDALFVANNLAVELIINTLQMLRGPEFNTSLYKANCLSIYAQLMGNFAEVESLFNLDRKQANLLADLPAPLSRNFDSWKKLPMAILVEKIIEAYGLNENSQRSHFPYLLAFRDIVGNFSANGDGGLGSFLQYWEEDGNKVVLPATPEVDAVQVSTIHKAKGLAYRAVFIPFATWSLDGLPGNIFWVPGKDTPYEGLQTLPVRYVKDLCHSSVGDSYYEELMKNYLDNLNLLYVATTRSKEYLHITVHKKKTDSLTKVSDLIIQTVTGYLPYAALVDDTGNLHIESAVNHLTASTSPKSLQELDIYPVSDRLEELMDETLPDYRLEMLLNESGKEGKQLHDLLSRIDSTAGLDAEIKLMMQEGMISENESGSLRAAALDVLTHEGLRNLLDGAIKTLNEQAIILPEGKIKRPDKVIQKLNEMVVLDYKFTSRPHREHEVQVNNYVQWIREMGYENVSGYLYYSMNKELKKVTA